MNQKAKRIFTAAMHGAVRLASTAAFRAKIWGRSFRELSGVPLHKLTDPTDQPLRRELIRQNAFAVNVFGRHLPSEKRRELLRQVNNRTTVVSSYKWHSIGKTAVYAAGGAATIQNPLIASPLISLAATTFDGAFRAGGHYDPIQKNILLEKKRSI